MGDTPTRGAVFLVFCVLALLYTLLSGCSSRLVSDGVSGERLEKVGITAYRVTD